MGAGDGRTRADDLDDVIGGATKRGERGGADIGDATWDADALGDGQLDGAGGRRALSACAHKGETSSPHRVLRVVLREYWSDLAHHARQHTLRTARASVATQALIDGNGPTSRRSR